MKDYRPSRRSTRPDPSSKPAAPSSGAPAGPWKSLAWIAALAVVAAFGWFGWSRISRIGINEVRVEGAVVSNVDRIRTAARIDMDTLLVAVAPSLVDDRVRRHPWVESASTRRLPDGTVSIRIEERTPVLLALSDDGRPAYYLDRQGHRMPFAAGHSFPVPLLRGLTEGYHPVRPVQHAAVRALVAALPDLEPEVDALLSEFLVDESGGLSLVTTPGSYERPLLVRLGKDRFDERLARLKAFWDQAVLTRPDVRYGQVDLRFEGQIITRESS